MQFSITGFVSGKEIEYSPSVVENNLGIFNGETRVKIPARKNAYGLEYTETQPPKDLSGIDIIDLERSSPYLYGKKNKETKYFSGDFTLPETYIYETCHGVRTTGNPLRNFYQGYYRYGFFEDPWGTNPTRTTPLQNFQVVDGKERRSLADSDATTAKDFTATQSLMLNSNEYHQLNGINPINCGGDSSAGCDPIVSAIQHFRYLYYECPNDVVIKSPTYREAEMKWVAGNGMVWKVGGTGNDIYLAAGGLYNNSPIPTVFDIHGSYQINDVCAGPSEKNVYSSLTCPALDLESETSVLKGSNSLLADYVANAVAGFGFGGLGGNGKGGYVAGPGAGAQDIGNEDWWYWYFVYKENSETFPFNDNPDKESSPGSTTKSIVNSDGSVSNVTTYKARGSNAAIQTFTSNIAQENWYWDHRLCPDFPKFLPWNLGASIFAHPETYFEVPYYSALGKFGFYGTRFLNTLGSLVDKNGNPKTGCNENGSPFNKVLSGESNSIYYDRLLKTASFQRKYNDYYAGNKGLFLALNNGYLKTDPGFSGLSDNVKSGLEDLRNVFWDTLGYSQKGYGSLLEAWIYDVPTLYQDGNKYIDLNMSGYLRSGVPDKFLYTNFLYEKTFTNESLLPDADKTFLDKYSRFIVKNTGAELQTSCYEFMSENQQYALSKRSIGHEVNGMPVDLFPLNRIYYSTDKASDHTGYDAQTMRLNTNSLTQIPRAYFQGYYASSSGVFPDLRYLTTFDVSGKPYGFNAGFYNQIDQFNMLPKRAYFKITSGEKLQNIVTQKSIFLSGLSLLGYNEIGKLDSDFSCFNPIFVQQPTDVICKIGQTPTFRALAVDYHTIPEDKINGARWPEINYWTKKLKLIDSQNKLLYPVTYKWGRFPIAEKRNYDLGKLSGIEWANKTGDWCGLEREGLPEFTLIHPKECRPTLTGYNTSITPGASKDFASYIQGCKTGIDDQYLYFCMASGRFGVRRSEPVNLIIDNTLMLDLAFSNGSPNSFEPVLAFHSYNKNNVYEPIFLTAAKTNPYYGFRPDKNAIPEMAMAERRTPSAAGCLPSWAPCCDDNRKRSMAMIGYSSWNYTWQPPNMQDLALLNSNWGRVINYGGLVTFSGKLSQNQGEALYGRVHLPKGANGEYIGEYFGVPFDLYLNKSTKVRHWSVEEAAWATDNTKEGIPFHSGDIPTALYPPSEGGDRYASYPYKTADQSYGKGHWQFSNNLGLIKRLGYKDLLGKNSTWDGKDDKNQVLITFSNNLTDKDKLLGSIKSSLSYNLGGSVGWRKSSLGRHMAYFVEGFSSFYLFCGNKKKEFIKNLSFIAPGLRVGNAGFQYTWVGQPNSAYLSRQTMPGPYAYFWRVNRHNRDKNGNGMPLGMYAHSSDGPYSMMYDLPAVYGLYLKSNKVDKNKSNIDRLKALRYLAASGQSSYVKAGANIWTQRIEFNSSENLDKTTHWCGSPFGDRGSSCDGAFPSEGTNAIYCEYPNYAIEVASNPDLDIYECPTVGIYNNVCFPPCLSLRYDQGIIPGGKELNLFGGSNNKYQPHKIISSAEYYGDSASKYALGPCYTPWARVLPSFLPSGLMPNLKKYQSIDPCYGGGSDHCNYVTPTVWLGSTQKGYQNINYMHSLISSFS